MLNTVAYDRGEPTRHTLQGQGVGGGGGLSMKTLVPLLSVGLLLGLTWSPGWGQPPHQEAVGAQGHEPSSQLRTVASDIPVDDLDRGTPRRMVEGFRRAARAHNYQRA